MTTTSCKVILMVLLLSLTQSPSCNAEYFSTEGNLARNLKREENPKQKYLRRRISNPVSNISRKLDSKKESKNGKKEKKGKGKKSGKKECKKDKKDKKGKGGKGGKGKKESSEICNEDSSTSKSSSASNDGGNGPQSGPIDSADVSSPNPDNYQDHITISFSAKDVSYVEQLHPLKNFNDKDRIKVDITGGGKSNNEQRALLKFGIACVAMPISRVKLILYVLDESRLGGLIYQITNKWQDHSVTWSTMPTKIDGPLNSVGKIVMGNFVEINLPVRAISGNGDVSFMIFPQDDNGAHYATEGDFRPSLEVTYSGTIPINGCNAVESRSMPMHSINSFQLKIYWEEGYQWQEESSETAWCVQCIGNCETGIVKIKECDNDNIKQFWHYNGSGKISSDYKHDYCIAYQHPPTLDQKLTMGKCSSSPQDKFTGLVFDSERFEWNPHENHMLCVTNPHHPRSDEDLRFVDCSIALRDNTSFWAVGSWDGHPSAEMP